MKYRIGFVSNSSTSSFVILVPTETHEKVLEKLHPYVKAMIEQVATKGHKLNSLSLVSIGQIHDMSGMNNWEYVELDNYEGERLKDEYGRNEDMSPSKCFEQYEEELNKVGKNSCIKVSVDM